MKDVFFRISRLISLLVLVHLILVMLVYFRLWFILDPLEEISPDWVSPYIFEYSHSGLFILLPLIFLFNWIVYGKISIWIKNEWSS